jgi:uncharacterized protein (TIGR03437 family)
MRKVTLLFALAGALYAQPSVIKVLNGASFSAAVSPGCRVSIFGMDLAAAPLNAPAGSLPTSLGGTSVSVAGVPAPLSYVSAEQVNAVIAFETPIPANTVVPLTVTNSSGSSTYNIRLTRDAPAIFTVNAAGTGRAAIFTEDMGDVSAVSPGDSIVFYATGLGPEDGGRLSDELTVYLGERLANVQSAAAIPGFPGVYRIQVTAPVPATDRLFLRSGGWQSNIVDVPIRAGSNTANVSGNIDGLYPSSDPFFTLPSCISDDPDAPPCSLGQDLAVMLHAGGFSVDLDIPAGAGAFDVAAVGEAGGAIISIDPTSGKYSASVTVPAAAARMGNFRDYVVPLWDYASCSPITALCLSFPGPSLIPPNRLSPFWLQATQSLPAATEPGSGPNGTVQSSGSITGSHFAIGPQNNADLSKFGGFVQAPYGPFDQLVSTFKLYVDGRLVAEKSLPYSVVHRVEPIAEISARH